MLKPEAMQRVVLVAAKRHQAAVIETLHDLQAAHFIEYNGDTRGDLEGFRIGAPLPTGAAASERLVRIRALLRHLGLEGADPSRPLAARDVDARLDAELDRVEREVTAAVEARESVRTTLAEGRETEAKLEPLRGLPLRLEDYRGYESLTPFVGRADDKFAADVAAVAPEHLLVRGEGSVFALFVPTAKAPAVSEILFRHGYAEVEVPAGAGSPDERIREIQAERATLGARLERAEADLARLAGQHKDLLLAGEEHLAIAVEKAEAPLSFATTENAFVVDAWVPASSVEAFEAAMRRATDGVVHLQRLEVETRHHGHADHDHGSAHDHHQHSPVDAMTVPKETLAPSPPTKYANARGVRRFEWFTNLFSVPRYDEIDPTVVFAVFFPLFFGFMIGDLGLGLLMIGLGFLLMRKLSRVDGMKQLGTAFMISGVVAAALGAVVFQDALGMPFGAPGHEMDVFAEEGLLVGETRDGHVVATMPPTLTAEGATFFNDHAVAEGHAADAVAGQTLTCGQFAAHAKEWTWSCFAAGAHGAVTVTHPLILKTKDITTMLLLSVGAAFVHLLIGLGFGIRNEIGHGAKHLGAKIGYLVLLLTFFPAVIALLAPEMLPGGIVASQAFMLAGVGFVLGAIILGWAEGIAGIVEIPGMFTAIMSYLRLGAIAIAKGAMAVAFNAMTIVAAMTGDTLMLVLGVLGFLVVQTVLFVLGMLSGGIQALRLNFVEFFTKFYKGGGTQYKPFGRPRRVTLVNPSGPAGTGPAGATLAASTITLKP